MSSGPRIPMRCGHCGRPNCRRCYNYATDEKFRAKFLPPGADAPGLAASGLTATKVAVAPDPPSPETVAELRRRLDRTGVCHFEGKIVEHAAGGCERSHIRICEHPDAAWDRCLRGPSADPENVPSCEACGLWQAKTPSGRPASSPPSASPVAETTGFQVAARAAPPIGFVRHLAYHVYPVAGNGAWQRNLDRLLWRINLFNGRRAVAIATPGRNRRHKLDPPEAVEEYLRGARCEFLRVTNSTRLGEVVAFVPLLGRITETARAEDAIFYAHAKGVTRPVDPGVTVHRWASLMYELNLDYWPHVRRLLKAHPIVGAFKKAGRGFAGSRSGWHYSGTFFWVRVGDLVAKNWRKIDQTWGGVEAWPGVHWRADEAGCVAVEGPLSGLNLYGLDFFDSQVEPACAAFRAAHAADRTDWSRPWP